jgi:hypothetical protein
MCTATDPTMRAAPAAQAVVLAATQRPATAAALSEGLPTDPPAGKHIPSWFVIGGADRNIPAAGQRFGAERTRSHRRHAP